MKKIIITLTCLLTAGSIYAQSNAIEEFQNKYHNTGKYFSLRIEGGILRTLASLNTDDPDTKDVVKLISGIDAIDIHSICKSETNFTGGDYNDLLKKIKREKFEDLMIVNDHDGRINFLIKESKGSVSDLVMLVNNLDEFLVMDISGNIDLHSIARLSEKMDFKGSENLEKLKDE